jgi:hypothetical protein
MEAVPARVQTGTTFGEVFFREATASCPNSVRFRSLPSVSNTVSGGYLNVLQQFEIFFSQNTRNKIVLPLFRFQNNAYDFFYRRHYFFEEYVSEMLYLGDTRT